MAQNLAVFEKINAGLKEPYTHPCNLALSVLRTEICHYFSALRNNPLSFL